MPSKNRNQSPKAKLIGSVVEVREGPEVQKYYGLLKRSQTFHPPPATEVRCGGRSLSHRLSLAKFVTSDIYGEYPTHGWTVQRFGRHGAIGRGYRISIAEEQAPRGQFAGGWFWRVSTFPMDLALNSCMGNTLARVRSDGAWVRR